MHTDDVQWHNTFPIEAIPGLGCSLSDVFLKLRAELNKSQQQQGIEVVAGMDPGLGLAEASGFRI